MPRDRNAKDERADVTTDGQVSLSNGTLQRKQTLQRTQADAEREPSLLLPDRPLPDLAPVLVDVIFETIERIREQDDTVLLLEQNALAALEIADTSTCWSLASSTCWVRHPSCSTTPSSQQPTWKAIGESDRL